MQPLIDTILEHPYADGPLLVLADWLMERGDPRGELLSLYPEIVKTIKQLPYLPVADFIDRRNKINRLYTSSQLRLFAALQSRYTPLGNDQLIGDLLTDVRSQRCVTAALLHAARLITSDQLEHQSNEAIEAIRASKNTWAFEAAQAAGFPNANNAAQCVRAAWAAWYIGLDWAGEGQAYRWQLNLALWLRSLRPLPTQIRHLLKVIDAASD